MTNQTFALPLLLAALAMSACVHTQPNPGRAPLANECEQLVKDTDTLATAAYCYRENPEVSSYFNDLSLTLLFNHPKAELCRRQLLQSPQKNYRLNTDPNKLCADTRAERNRLRRQVEAFADSKMAEYAAAEAHKRGISAAELLRQTRAEEAARRARVDAAIRRMEGR